MKEDVIQIVDENGKEKVYNVLLTFDSDNTNKSYVVYTDYSLGDNGCINVYSSSYLYVNDKLELRDIDTEFELNYINNFLKEQQKNTDFILKTLKEY